MRKNYIILEANQDIHEALALVWNVFLEFEATEYSREGVEEFRKFIQVDTFQEGLISKAYRMWCCYDGDRVIGVIATRAQNHICLLFVDKAYHRQGIARALFEEMLHHIDAKSISVNSSPYALQAYRKLGFKDKGKEVITNGIRYIPMKYRIKKS